jgi:hypothetical protein
MTQIRTFSPNQNTFIEVKMMLTRSKKYLHLRELAKNGSLLEKSPSSFQHTNQENFSTQLLNLLMPFRLLTIPLPETTIKPILKWKLT